MNDPSVGGDLDTGCTFRNERPNGRLTIMLAVTRVVPDVDQAKKLGTLRPMATLRLPAYDVDEFADPPAEVDQVYFNGQMVGTLTGDNDIWKLNQFDIPVENIHFATVDSSGNITPGMNVIEVAIDTASPADEDNWCTSVDWVELTVDIDPPVLLVHGIFSKGKTWERMPPDVGIDFEQMLLDKGFEVLTPSPSLGGIGGVQFKYLILDSIQSNAEKIHGYAQQLMNRTGTTKINIVAHSKGGLDAREFMEEYPDMVNKLIQIGTPNGGSELANYGVALGALLSPVLVNLSIFVAPAAIQLTTPYMALYNFTHGYDHDAQYITLAGNYLVSDSYVDELQGIEPLGYALVGNAGGTDLIPDASDLLVRVDSAFAGDFPRLDENILDSRDADNQSEHSYEPGSSNFFNAVLPYLRGSETKSAESAQRSEARPAKHPMSAEVATGSLSMVASSNATLMQGAAYTTTFSVDQSSRLLVAMMSPLGDDLSVSLNSPGGIVYDATTVPKQPAASLTTDNSLGSNATTFTLDNPEVGQWTATVTANTALESGGAPFVLSSNLVGAAIQFTATAASPYFQYGQPLKLTGTLTQNGTPLPGGGVSAVVLRPDSTQVAIPMYDDGTNGDAIAGDGIYTGVFTQGTTAGAYRCLLTASGSGFTRQAMALAFASSASGSFTGVYSDTAPDTDGDGLAESLQLSAGVNVSAAGRYRVTATLQDSAGGTVSAQTALALPAGASKVYVNFDGGSLFANHVDGPYTVSSISLSEVADDGSVNLLAHVSDAYRTAFYPYANFEHADITVTGVQSFEGVDTNGNSLFDQLQVTLGVELVDADSYLYSVQLFDGQGKEIGFKSDTVSLLAGETTLTTTFDGTAIGQNGADGPFYVRNLLIRGDTGSSFVASQAYSFGETLKASQFEGYTAPTPTPTPTPSPTPTPAPPVVTIEALGDAEAVEGGENGKVAIRRDGDTTGPLVVRYKVVGGVVAGVDYKTLTDTVAIPAGAAQVKIKLKAINDHVHEGTRVAKVKLKAAVDGSYNLGSPSTAKVRIIDND